MPDSNYVEILVRSRDEAKPDLDDLKAKLQELSHEVATARAEVDDADAAAKLDRLSAKLLDLDHRTANPKIRMAGALRAEADIHAVEASLDNLKRKEDEAIAAAGPRGLLSRIVDGIQGGSGKITGAGGGTLFSNPYSLAAIAAGVTALLPELVGLASGFAAAGAGAVSFYALAKPTITNLTQDYAALQSAQSAYSKAQEKASLDPTKANLKAEQTALENLRAVRKGMTEDEGAAAAGIARLSAEYHKLTTAFAPDVFKTFNLGLKLAADLLPAVLPFARSFASALDGLLRQADKFATSQGFKDWLAQFQKLSGPAVTAIGEGIGQVAVQIGKLLTVMSKKDVVNAINIAFNILSGTIDGLRHVLEGIMRTYDNVSRTMQRDSHDIAASFDQMRHGIANAFDSIRHGLADSAHQWAGTFDQMRHNIAAWTDDVGRFLGRVVSFFQQLPAKIVHALAALPGMLFRMGQQVVEGFVRGIESMLGSIIHAAESMISSLGSKVLHLLGIGSPSRVAHWWGEMIAQGLAEGISAGSGGPAAAATRMIGGVMSGMGGYGGGGAGRPQRIELVWTGGDSPIFQALRQGIRIRGGNVQSVLGHG